MSKLEYEEKRIILFFSVIFIVSVTIGFFIGKALRKDNNEELTNKALIIVFNERTDNLLNKYPCLEYNDAEKVIFIQGYTQRIKDQIDEVNARRLKLSDEHHQRLYKPEMK